MIVLSTSTGLLTHFQGAFSTLTLKLPNCERLHTTNKNILQ